MVIELFSDKFNFAMMLELVTQFSIVSIVFVFHIFIAFCIVFCVIKPKIINKTSLTFRRGGTKFYRGGGAALKEDPGIFKICVHAAVK